MENKSRKTKNLAAYDLAIVIDGVGRGHIFKRGTYCGAGMPPTEITGARLLGFKCTTIYLGLLPPDQQDAYRFQMRGLGAMV